MPITPRTASSSSTSTAAIIFHSPSTTATTSSMIHFTAPSTNPHRYAINPHHHTPQNPLQSRTNRHPSMDSQRWDSVLAPLHLPQIWLLQRHKTNETAGLQRDPAASRCLYIWGEWDWGVYVKGMLYEASLLHINCNYGHIADFTNLLVIKFILVGL